MDFWGITLGAAQIGLALLTLLAGFVAYVGAKVAAHLVGEEVEGRIDQLGFALVHLACLCLPAALREEYYQWWRADLAEHFQREKERPITRLFWAVWFPVPLLFTGRKTARILNAEAFTVSPTRQRLTLQTFLELNRKLVRNPYILTGLGLSHSVMAIAARNVGAFRSFPDALIIVWVTTGLTLVLVGTLRIIHVRRAAAARRSGSGQ